MTAINTITTTISTSVKPAWARRRGRLVLAVQVWRAQVLGMAGSGQKKTAWWRSVCGRFAVDLRPMGGRFGVGVGPGSRWGCRPGHQQAEVVTATVGAPPAAAGAV
jgi:hypothetical protein